MTRPEHALPTLPERKSEDQKTPKETVYECLKNWIIFTEFKPGTPLNERDLARQFGISRTPLREILQRLSYQRLIVIRPRKGIFVAPIDYFTIKAIFEARIPVEKTAASLAAMRATPADIESLQGIVDRSVVALEKGDYIGLIQLDQNFHETLMQIARNEVLQEIAEDLHNVCLRFWYLRHGMIGERYESVQEMKQIVKAIRDGNHQLASTLHGQHVMSFVNLFDEHSAEELRTLFSQT